MKKIGKEKIPKQRSTKPMYFYLTKIHLGLGNLTADELLSTFSIRRKMDIVQR